MFQVVLAKNNKSINYLFGIAGVLLTLIVMFEAGLYAEFTLNIYYLVMSIYGWFYWLSKKGNAAHQETKITRNTQADWVKTGLIVVLSFIIFALVLSHYTDSKVPLWDALVSAFAWAGMWLLAKRKLSNWWILNVSNFIAIPLMIYKELYLFAALDVFLFVVAIYGYRNWLRIIK